jgi:hypothetical protein
VGLNNLVSVYSITSADCSGFEPCTEPIEHTDCTPVPVDAGYGGVVSTDEVNVYRIFCDTATRPSGGLGQPLYRMRVMFLPTNGLECVCCTVRIVDDSGFHGSLFTQDTVTQYGAGAVSVHKPADPAAWRAAINDQCILELDLYGDAPWELFVELGDCCAVGETTHAWLGGAGLQTINILSAHFGDGCHATYNSALDIIEGCCPECPGSGTMSLVSLDVPPGTLIQRVRVVSRVKGTRGNNGEIRCDVGSLYSGDALFAVSFGTPCPETVRDDAASDINRNDITTLVFLSFARDYCSNPGLGGIERIEITVTGADPWV